MRAVSAANITLFLLVFNIVPSVRAQTHSVNLWRMLAAHTSSPGNGWFWSWMWGSESTVSIVDRNPTLTFPSKPAAFGSEMDGALLGYVIPLSSFTAPCSELANETQLSLDDVPNWGCPKLCSIGPHEPDPAESWIALVQRGDCPFVEKAREAQRLGARAVVVGGPSPDLTGLPDTLVNMYSKGDASDVTIAATYIKHVDYKELFSLIANSNTSHAGLRTLSLLIHTQHSAWEWYSPIITFITILILPSCLTFITLLIHRVRLARAAQRDRAPEDYVKSLPWRVWTGTGWEKHEGILPHPDPSTSTHQNVDLEAGEAPSMPAPVEPSPSNESGISTSQSWFETQMECAICLSEFVKGDKVRELPCHHIFHLDEVDAWLITRKKLCPICKADVTQPWHLSQVQKPSAPVDEDPSTTEHTPQPLEQPVSVATERTPLLHDHHRSHTDS